MATISALRCYKRIGSQSRYLGILGFLALAVVVALTYRQGTVVLIRNETATGTTSNKGQKITTRNNETNLDSSSNISSSSFSTKKSSKSAATPSSTVRASYLPNVQMIGMEKGGTTALQAALTSLGMGKYICGGIVKEVHFFNRVRLHPPSSPKEWEDQIQWYEKNYRGNCSSTTKYIMDATPATFWMPDVFYDFYKQASNHKNTNKNSTAPIIHHPGPSDLKLIVSLREPVSRELSQYNMKINMCTDWETYQRKKSYCSNAVTVADAKRKTFHVPPFRQFIQSTAAQKCQPPLKLKRYGQECRGHYFPYLKRFFELFDRKNQILVLSYEELQSHPDRVLQRLQDFLDIPRNTSYQLEQVWSNAGPYKVKMPTCEEQQTLQQLYQDSNQQLYELLDNDDPGGPSMEQHPFPQFQLGNCSQSRNKQ